MEMRKGIVKFFDNGQHCKCPLYFGCWSGKICKLKDDYIKAYPIEIANDDELGDFSKEAFNWVSKQRKYKNL